MGTIHPPIQWILGALSLGVKWPGGETDHSPPISAEVNKHGSIRPLPHVFMVSCLISWNTEATLCFTLCFSQYGWLVLGKTACVSETYFWMEHAEIPFKRLNSVILCIYWTVLNFSVMLCSLEALIKISYFGIGTVTDTCFPHAEHYYGQYPKTVNPICLQKYQQLWLVSAEKVCSNSPISCTVWLYPQQSLQYNYTCPIN
jgi:hypothetical protein